MNKEVRNITLFFCVIFVTVLGDIIYLKNGGRVEGVIKEEDSTTIIVDIGFGEMPVGKDEIDSISLESKKENIEFKKEWIAEREKSKKIAKEQEKKKPAGYYDMPYEPSEITIYVTPWCAACKRAIYFFSANDIPHRVYDIEKSKIGRELYKKYGTNRIPLIIIGNKKFIGFNIKQIASELMKYRRFHQ